MNKKDENIDDQKTCGAVGLSDSNALVRCDVVSGKSILSSFNNQNQSMDDYVSLKEHIDFAIDMGRTPCGCVD